MTDDLEEERDGRGVNELHVRKDADRNRDRVMFRQLNAWKSWAQDRTMNAAGPRADDAFLLDEQDEHEGQEAADGDESALGQHQERPRPR